MIRKLAFFVFLVVIYIKNGGSVDLPNISATTTEPNIECEPNASMKIGHLGDDECGGLNVLHPEPPTTRCLCNDGYCAEHGKCIIDPAQTPCRPGSITYNARCIGKELAQAYRRLTISECGQNEIWDQVISYCEFETAERMVFKFLDEFTESCYCANNFCRNGTVCDPEGYSSFY